MPNFVHPALLWGLALAALPILIHLINSLRHRPVSWAAMEFLLASQKRSRKWIVLKQWLLLAARVAAVAGVVLLVAQPTLEGGWLGALGAARVHHLVLLDDSFSMTDRVDDAGTFPLAVDAVRQIAARSAEPGASGLFSLVRFSQAVRPSPRRELWKESAGADFAAKLEQTVRGLTATALDTKPQAALAKAAQWLEDPRGEATEIYLVGDFRAADWQDAAAYEPIRRRLQELKARVHLVRCVERQHENLAVAAIKTLPGPYAAGVPLAVEVTVHNFGAQAAQNVAIQLAEDGQARPGVQVDRIAPGKSETRRFSVQFAAAGQHEVSAAVQADAIDADNRRWAMLDLPLQAPVLLVDGGPETVDGRFVAHTLAPGGGAVTGFAPQIESPGALTTKRLNDYHSVWLLNTGYLETSAIEALTQYVQQGGGVAMFCGELTDAAFTTGQLYRDGQGLFPAPLVGRRELLIDRLETPPDVEPTDHPIFRVLLGQRNSFLNSVAIASYYGVAEGWPSAEQTDRQVIARLRNGAPLAIERRLGPGAVVAVLTTAAPVWNNWARNPSYVVAMLELASHLGGGRPRIESQPVGEPLKLTLDPAVYLSRVGVRLPADNERSSAAADSTVDAAVTAQELVAQWNETDRPGVYRWELSKHDGSAETRLAARNVTADEGDTRIAQSSELAAALEGLEFDERPARGLQYAVGGLGGANLSRWLLGALVALLAVEQLLAWSASYHPSPGRQGVGR